MLSGDLAEFLHVTFGNRRGTVDDYGKDLRDNGLLSKKGRGPRSGAHMTESDCVSWIFAVSIDHKRGDSISENVRRLRSLPLGDKTVIGKAFANQLEISRAKTAGHALDSILRDMRGPTYGNFEKAASHPVDLCVTLDSENEHVSVSLIQKDALAGSAAWDFRRAAPHRALVWRHVYIRGSVFHQLAKALGPPE